MKKLLILALLALSTPTLATDVNAYVSAYNVNNESTAVVAGMHMGHVGIETVFLDSDVGGSIYLSTAPDKDFKFYIGVTDMPDTAIVNVPTYGNFQDSTNSTAPMIGFDYKMVSIRYLQYDATHTVTQSTYNTVTKTFDNVQTGKTKSKKESVWIGVTYKF